MPETIAVQPVGPDGPPCLRVLRDNEIARSTRAVLEACKALLGEGIRPSIAKAAARSGCSISTINRDRCKSILADYRRRSDLVSAGLPLADTLALTEAEVLERCPDAVPTPKADVDPEIARLNERIARLEAKVETRDGQLRYVLTIVRSIRGTLRWHRTERAKLITQLDALSEETIAPRRPRRWRDDFEAPMLDDIPDDDEDEEEEDVRVGKRRVRR